jgi:CRP-like cAMP-binding protein
VETGLLRQFYYKGGRDVTEHFASEGNGMMCIKSLFNSEPSELIIEALEKGIVYYTPYKQLIGLADQYPALNTYIRRILEFSLIISQIKADSWRFETARERYNRFVTDFPEVSRRASINHIASYLLMTPESLSRVRSGTL